MKQRTLICIFLTYVLLCFLLLMLSFAEEVPVKFQWNASTGNVAGYALYQGVASGQYDPSKTTDIPGTGTTGTMLMDTAVSRYVAADAYDPQKNRSAFSNEILCHPVITSINSGGTITPGGSFFVQDGNSVTFTIAPDTGNYVKNVSVNDSDVGSVLAYTVAPVKTRTTVNVNLEPFLSHIVTYDLVTVTPRASQDSIIVEFPSTGAAENELRLLSFERKTYQSLGATNQATKSVTLTKTGHYIVESRGCTGSGTTRSCSAWVSSTDPFSGPKTRKEDGTVITQGWWLYQYARTVGPIQIR